MGRTHTPLREIIKSESTVWESKSGLRRWVAALVVTLLLPSEPPPQPSLCYHCFPVQQVLNTRDRGRWPERKSPTQRGERERELQSVGRREGGEEQGAKPLQGPCRTTCSDGAITSDLVLTEMT